jgi:hypothetical protein
MKTLAGTVGFVMLFAVPTELTLKTIMLYALWLCAAVFLLVYAGGIVKTLKP